MLSYFLTPRSRVLEKLTSFQIVTKIPVFYGSCKNVSGPPWWRFVATYCGNNHHGCGGFRNIKQHEKLCVFLISQWELGTCMHVLKLGKFKIKTHCTSLLSYLRCRYSFQYERDIFYCYQCRGWSPLTYSAFIIHQFS